MSSTINRVNENSNVNRFIVVGMVEQELVVKLYSMACRGNPSTPYERFFRQLRVNLRIEGDVVSCLYETGEPIICEPVERKLHG